MGLKKVVRLIRPIFLLISIFISIKLIAPVSPYQTSTDNTQIQGVWMSHLGTSFLSYTTLLDNAFYQLLRLGFNRVYIDVYNGNVTYPSKYASRNYKVSLPFTDPLQATIKEGKRQSLKIYAWYEHGMMMFRDDRLVNFGKARTNR